VRLSLGNLQANAESIADYLALSCEERAITTLPMHYAYGLSVLNSHFLAGATVLLTAQPVTTRRFWDMLRRCVATSIAGVPIIFSMLRQMHFETMSLPSSLHTLTVAGGALSPDSTRWHAELALSRGQRFFVMYGQTEATARIAYVPPERLLDKIGAIGIAIPGGQLELIDKNSIPVTTVGVTGELCYRGPNVMLGYTTGIADLAYPDTQGGFLRTGDLAWRDEEGYFFIAGRLQRFIKISGNRIDLDEIEAQLRASGHDVAVTGRDDLLVVALRGTQTSADILASEVPAHYRLHHGAVKVVTIDKFPLSSTGKIRYGDLLAATSSDHPPGEVQAS
jgi:long-chain acyl-CoA synthetase